MDRGELLKQAKLFQVIDMYGSSNIYHDRTNLKGKKGTLTWPIQFQQCVLEGIELEVMISSLYEPKDSHANIYTFLVAKVLKSHWLESVS